MLRQERIWGALLPTHVVVADMIERGGAHMVVARSGRYYAVKDVASGDIVAVVSDTGNGPGWRIIELKLESDRKLRHENCPVRILKVLTHTRSRNARAWRQRCWINADKERPEPGDMIDFDPPIVFGHDEAVDRMLYLGGCRFAVPGRFVYHRLIRTWHTQTQWRVADVTPEERLAWADRCSGRQARMVAAARYPHAWLARMAEQSPQKPLMELLAVAKQLEALGQPEQPSSWG